MKRIVLLLFGLIVAGFAAYAIPRELPREAFKFEIQIELPSMFTPVVAPVLMDNLERTPQITMVIDQEASEFTWQSASEGIWIQHYPAGAFTKSIDPVRQAYRRGDGFTRLC